MSLINWKSSSSDKAGHSIQTVLLSDQPEFLLKLAEGIAKLHAAEGDSSPISPTLMEELVSKTKFAKEKHEEGMRYLRIANEIMMERDAILGTRLEDKYGEASLKFYLRCVKDILAQGKNDQVLAKWGFVIKK